MCGITGIVLLNGKGEIPAGRIEAMTGALAHRGPDDRGWVVRSPVALGNARLSIIDVAGGRQPISTADGRWTIVYNGEIFNFRTLRTELEAEGEVFTTATDTEVILRGFARRGPEFLDRLDGMFACLIFDAREATLFAARDPFGIKPLYRYTERGVLFLASEVRAIREGAASLPGINVESLRTFLTCGYPAGRKTLLDGIERIPAGTLVRVTGNGRITEERFDTRLRPAGLAQATGPGDDPKRTIIQAVERSLVADVPVGLYLSGGIDSSLIAAIVSRELGRKLESFSVRFPEDPSHDEGPFAEKVAEELGLPHTSIAASPADFADLNALARTLEEPLADPSAVALGLLSSLAAQRLKVVLSGEGADELFGGYHRYYWDRVVRRYLRLPGTVRTGIERIAHGVGSSRVRRRVEKLSETVGLSPPTRYAAWFSPFAPGDRFDLLADAPARPPDYEKTFEAHFEDSEILPGSGQVQWVDLVTYLRDDLLLKADKMSMAHGLEVRVPYLQMDVARAAFHLPERERVRARKTKPFLRSMLGSYLSPEITERRKQGFEIPLNRWFRGPLKPVLDRYLSESIVRSRGLFRWEAVASIQREFEAGTRDAGLALFSLCLVEAWCQEWLETSLSKRAR